MLSDYKLRQTLNLKDKDKQLEVIKNIINDEREEEKIQILSKITADIYKDREDTFEKDLLKSKMFFKSAVKEKVSSVYQLMLLTDEIKSLNKTQYRYFVYLVQNGIERYSLPFN